MLLESQKGENWSAYVEFGNGQFVILARASEKWKIKLAAEYRGNEDVKGESGCKQWVQCDNSGEISSVSTEENETKADCGGQDCLEVVEVALDREQSLLHLLTERVERWVGCFQIPSCLFSKYLCKVFLFSIRCHLGILLELPHTPTPRWHLPHNRSIWVCEPGSTCRWWGVGLCSSVFIERFIFVTRLFLCRELRCPV